MGIDGKTNLELFRDLFENSSDIMLVVEPLTGKLAYVNNEASRALGYSRTELLEKKITSINKTFSSLNAWNRFTGSFTNRKGKLIEIHNCF